MRWASRPDAIAAGAYLDTLDFKFAVGEHLAKTAVEIPPLICTTFYFKSGNVYKRGMGFVAADWVRRHPMALIGSPRFQQARPRSAG